MNCPSCGHDNPAGNKFCGECGAGLPPVCASCQAEIQPDSKFCGQCGSPVSATPDAPPQPSESPESEAERRQLTVMFCDLANSTALSEKLDPEELRDLIAQYQSLCAGAIESFEGYIARYMGDGILVYFGYPQAHEDDAERAVRAGLSIIGELANLTAELAAAIQVRIGIATGLVVAGDIIGEGASEEHAVLGVTPNLAARLQGLAEPNSLVISDATKRLIEGFFECVDLGPQYLKGISEAERAWRISGESDAASRFEALSGQNLSPVVGRDEEISLIQNRWHQATGGEGQVVMIFGEAGVGKSRILQEFSSRIAGQIEGATLLSCSPFYTNTAFHPLINCLERVVGIVRGETSAEKYEKLSAFIEASGLQAAEMAPPLARLLGIAPSEDTGSPDISPEELRKKVIESILAILEARSAKEPLLWIVEDAHWLDPSTAAFLEMVVERCQPFKLLLIIAARPEFNPGWAQHPHVTSITLNRLGRHNAAELVLEVTGGKALPAEILEQIIEKTDGVPLFVEELTKTILESGFLKPVDGHFELTGPLPQMAIPSSLQDSLMARLDRLAPVKEIAQTAAVIGRRFGFDLLSTISRLSTADLENALVKLIEAQLIYRIGMPPNAEYEFKHALLQDAAYESLLRSTRQRHHQEIAQSIEANFPQRAAEEPELLAHHFTEAGLAEKAVPYWREAGNRAVTNWANAEAAGHLTKGLEAVAGIDDDTARAEHEIPMLIDLVSAYRILDRYDDALQSLDAVQALADRYNRLEDLSLIHFMRGNIYFPLGNIDGCLEEHGLARETAKAAGSVEREVRALGGLGDAHYMRGHMITANRHFDECVTLSQSNGLDAIAASNLPMRGHTQLYMLQLESGLQDTLDAAELAQKDGNRRAEMIARGSCAGKILFDMGRYDEANEQCTQAIALARQLGNLRFEPINQVIMCKVLRIQGRYEEAEAMAKEAEVISLKTGPRYTGPMTMGALAVVATESVTRTKALADGIEMLKDDCVGHNYLWFYRDAINASLMENQWNKALEFADAAEQYTTTEPLPWMTLLIERGRLLAELGINGTSAELMEKLGALRDSALQKEFRSPLPMIERALAE